MSTRKAFAFSALSKYSLLFFQLISTTIIARILTPEDIGIYSIAFSVVAFGHLIRNFGVTQFIIQEKDLSEEKIKAAFTVTLIMAWTIAVILFVSANSLGDFYNKTEITNVLKFLSLNFILLPFSSITIAFLRRNMAFRKLTVIDIISGLVALSVAISTALMGAKYYCLVWSANAEIITTIIISMFYRPKNLPFMPGFKKIRYVLSFGSKIGLSNIIAQLSQSLSDLLIGRFLGLSSLGMFSRAYGTFMLFEYTILQSIKPVILPLFSGQQNKGANINPLFIRSIEYTSALSLPFYLFLFLFTEDLIHVLYGNQWDIAIPLIKILCIGGALVSIFSFFDQILISQSKEIVVLRYNLLSHCYLIVAIIPASMHSLRYVAWTFTSYLFVQMLLSLSYFKKYLSIKMRVIIRVYLKCVIISFFTLFPAATIFKLYPEFHESPFIRLPILMSITLIAWFFSIFIFKHPILYEFKVIFSKFGLQKKQT